MDDRGRDTTNSASEASADDEYELDLPDATVPRSEERPAKPLAEAATDSIDLDEIYREAERNRGGEILEHWIRNFRFQVKHVLIATAVTAIALTLYRFGLLWNAIVLLFMLSVAGLYGYLRWEERKHQAEVTRNRYELYARRRERLGAPDIGKTSSEPARPIPTAPPVPLPPDESDEIWREATTREPFRFRFSLQSLIIAMTAAAVILGMIRMLGGPAPTATILGLIAVCGLIAHALGFEPPQSVILGWWFILVLYVLVSILGTVWIGLS